MTTPRTHPGPRRRRLFLAIGAALGAGALVAGLSAAALHQADEPTASKFRTSAPTPASAPASSSAAGAGEVVAPVRAAAIDGRPVAVPGERATLLFFMAAWCASCIEGAHAMADLEGDYAGTVDFVAVNVTPSDTVADVEEFARAAGGTHPYLIDSAGDFLTQYAIFALDTTVVVAADGRVLDRLDGRPLNAGEMRTFLNAALA